MCATLHHVLVRSHLHHTGMNLNRIKKCNLLIHSDPVVLSSFPILTSSRLISCAIIIIIDLTFSFFFMCQYCWQGLARVWRITIMYKVYIYRPSKSSPHHHHSQFHFLVFTFFASSIYRHRHYAIAICTHEQASQSPLFCVKFQSRFMDMNATKSVSIEPSMRRRRDVGGECSWCVVQKTSSSSSEWDENRKK